MPMKPLKKNFCVFSFNNLILEKLAIVQTKRMIAEIVSVVKLCRVIFHFKVFKMNVVFSENNFPICIISL